MQTVALIFLLLGSQAQPKEVIWTGVFSDAQAQRGEAAYELHCAKCHRDNLDDSTSPKLIGDFFMERWREDSLESLYMHMRTRMPADAPGTLTDKDYLDILARATEPRRTRTPDEATLAKLNASKALAPGENNFKLQNLDELRTDFRADIYKGQTVQVKGVLLRDGNTGARLNVTSFETVATTCYE